MAYSLDFNINISKTSETCQI